MREARTKLVVAKEIKNCLDSGYILRPKLIAFPNEFMKFMRLEDYRPLLEEKQFQIQFCLSDHTVYSDRRGLRFLLGQVISNSIKYCSGEPKLRLEFLQEGNCNVLKVRDNGMGVRSCDLPYLFEKGFTGDSGNGRKKATGMGLYLVKEIAKDLNIPLNVDSEWGKYFEIQISFPIVKEKSERAF